MREVADLGGAPDPADAVARHAVETAVLQMPRTGEQPEDIQADTPTRR